MLTVILVVGLLLGLYMAWNIGANDVANAMGTSVGSGALSLRRAILVAAVFEFSGAVLVGSHVTKTVKKGIVDIDAIGDPMLFVVVMLSALLAAGLWLQFATWRGLPVSTTHSIVGGVAGAGVAAAGLGGVEWDKLAFIATSWVLSPLFGAAIGFVIFRFIAKGILGSRQPKVRVRQTAPWLAALVFFILTLSLFYKGLKNLSLDMPFGRAVFFAAGIAVIAGVCAEIWMRTRGNHDRGPFGYVERNFGWLQVLTACYVAFAHGSNDVANAIGPLAGIYGVWEDGAIHAEVGVPVWILAMGGAGIVVGLATWGYRVMETIGRKITELTPSRGFSAEFAAATTVLLCTKMGLPISTTHTLVGAVIGVGFARGLAALDLRVLRDIIASWLVTLPVSIVLAATFCWILMHFVI